MDQRNENDKSEFACLQRINSGDHILIKSKMIFPFTNIRQNASKKDENIIRVRTPKYDLHI
jgi:hypothetical protein